MVANDVIYATNVNILVFLLDVTNALTWQLLIWQG